MTPPNPNPPPMPPATPPVSDYVNGSCSTSVVLGLSLQISEEVDCIASGTLARVPESGGIAFSGSAVLPYLAPDANRDLQAVSGAREINSAFRVVVQQYLLYRWWQQGRCGIAAAATPGNSNHETGRAVDLQDWSAEIPPMAAHGWSHDVPGDDVHFDHLASPDLRGMDVHAFQRLWNRNHPEDTIDEDGVYGPMTEARILRSPSGGFPMGACGHSWIQPENIDFLNAAALRPALVESAD